MSIYEFTARLIARSTLRANMVYMPRSLAYYWLGTFPVILDTLIRGAFLTSFFIGGIIYLVN